MVRLLLSCWVLLINDEKGRCGIFFFFGRGDKETITDTAFNKSCLWLFTYTDGSLFLYPLISIVRKVILHLMKMFKFDFFSNIKIWNLTTISLHSFCSYFYITLCPVNYWLMHTCSAFWVWNNFSMTSSKFLINTFI